MCLHICVSCSRHHVYIWERWRSDHIHMATEWASEHSSRPAGHGLQHPAERSNTGASQQLLWVRGLSQTAHRKYTIYLRIFYGKLIKYIPILPLKWFIDPFINVHMVICTRKQGIYKHCHLLVYRSTHLWNNRGRSFYSFMHMVSEFTHSVFTMHPMIHLVLLLQLNYGPWVNMSFQSFSCAMCPMAAEVYTHHTQAEHLKRCIK